MTEAGSRSSASERFTIIAFIAFLTVVLLFGGASRADVFGQGMVRIAAVLLIAVSIMQIGREGWHFIRVPALLLIGLIVVIALQLVPLPPTVWQALPGRGLYADAHSAAGMVPGWSPLSLTPDLTLNSLLAALPPLATIMAMGVLGRRTHPLLVSVLLVGIAISALIGIVQISTGSPYFYKVTNVGAAVGVFANRNHAAFFIAMAFPLLAGWAYFSVRDQQAAAIRLWVALCCAAAIFPLLLVTGSRGGLIVGLVGAALAAVIALGAQRARSRGAEQAPQPRRLLPFLLPLLVGAVAIVLFVYFARDEALRRMFHDQHGTVRGDFLPIYLSMVADFFPVGSGFGSFDAVFRSYEPHWALNIFYLNHAHNDLAELLIEGGLPALIVLVAFLAWWLARSVRLWGSPMISLQQLRGRVGSAIVVIVLLGSLVDYPLRTPIIAVVVAIACCWMAKPRGDERLGDQMAVR